MYVVSISSSVEQRRLPLSYKGKRQDTDGLDLDTMATWTVATIVQLCYYLSILDRYRHRLLGSLAHGSLSGPASILVDFVVTSSFVTFEHLDLLGRHQAGYHIGLNLLELEAETLVRAVFFVCLVLPISTWDT